MTELCHAYLTGRTPIDEPCLNPGAIPLAEKPLLRERECDHKHDH